MSATSTLEEARHDSAMRVEASRCWSLVLLFARLVLRSLALLRHRVDVAVARDHRARRASIGSS